MFNSGDEPDLPSADILIYANISIARINDSVIIVSDDVDGLLNGDEGTA